MQECTGRVRWWEEAHLIAGGDDWR